MNEQQIRELCPKVDRITITPDGTIGLKVGEFSQAINLTYNQNHDAAKRQIRDLYNDLMGMNREQAKQIQEAKRNLERGNK